MDEHMYVHMLNICTTYALHMYDIYTNNYTNICTHIRQGIRTPNLTACRAIGSETRVIGSQTEL